MDVSLCAYKKVRLDIKLCLKISLPAKLGCHKGQPLYLNKLYYIEYKCISINDTQKTWLVMQSQFEICSHNTSFIIPYITPVYASSLPSHLPLAATPPPSSPTILSTPLPPLSIRFPCPLHPFFFPPTYAPPHPLPHPCLRPSKPSSSPLPTPLHTLSLTPA